MIPSELFWTRRRAWYSSNQRTSPLHPRAFCYLMHITVTATCNGSTFPHVTLPCGVNSLVSNTSAQFTVNTTPCLRWTFMSHLLTSSYWSVNLYRLHRNWFWRNITCIVLCLTLQRILLFSTRGDFPGWGVCILCTHLKLLIAMSF